LHVTRQGAEGIFSITNGSKKSREKIFDMGYVSQKAKFVGEFPHIFAIFHVYKLRLFVHSIATKQISFLLHVPAVSTHSVQTDHLFSACCIVAKAKPVQKKMWSCAKIVAKQFTWPDSRLQGQTL
jgi:hypothetical protein